MGNPVLQRLVDERDQTNKNIDSILDTANEEERDPSESERELIQRHRVRLTELDPQINELLDLEETRTQARDARAVLDRGAVRRDVPADNGDREPATPDPLGEYQTFAQYARDEMLQRFPAIAATVEPMVRHRAKERLRRAVETVLTADVPGLLPPQYIREIMQVIDSSRPIVDRSRRLNLTAGQIQYPRITARPTVAQQVTEKTEVGVGTMTVAMQTKVAKTFLCSANFSWQTVQWSNPDAMALWFDLAAADYAKKTDADAAALLAAADSTPTAVTGWALGDWTAAIAAAAGDVYAATGRYADTIFADPATGFKLVGIVSQVAPVFLSTGGANLATGSFPSIGGLQMVISAGLPAKTVVVGDADALLTAETAGAPVELRAVEPSIGGIEVGIIGAFLSEIIDPGAFAELTPP